jgi:hypothetical protein
LTFSMMVGVGGPDKRLGFAVVLAKVTVDRRLQIDQRAKRRRVAVGGE